MSMGADEDRAREYRVLFRGDAVIPDELGLDRVRSMLQFQQSKRLRGVARQGLTKVAHDCMIVHIDPVGAGDNLLIATLCRAASARDCETRLR